MQGADLSADTIGMILEEKITYFLDQMKLLKVINSPRGNKEMQNMLKYFKELDDWMDGQEKLILEGVSLKKRAEFMKKSIMRKVRSISIMLENNANDDILASLNLAQQAEYLRRVEISKNSRGLAKRAVASGTDFDEKIRREVIAMGNNEDELKDVEENEMQLDLSFYSQDSTLESIRQLCAIARNPEVIENITAVEILEMFSIVGVPCVAPIGDYPDPMTYRISRLLLGSYVSVADLTVAQISGGKLQDPVSREEITNIIPIFTDQRIQLFLQKYAQTCLECICSIGMRRILAEVPKTYPYTICAGVWKMVEDLNSSKTDLNITLFNKMIHSYNTSIGDYYHYLFPLFETNQDSDKSYFLNHNSITNMIGPIFELVKNGNVRYMDRILRALFSYETYQAMRRVCKHQDPSFRKEILDKLLGVDFKLRGTPLPPMFERPEEKHCTEYGLDREEFEKLKKEIWYVKFVTLLEPFFSATLAPNHINAMRAVPSLSEDLIAERLHLKYSLEEFVLFNIVEGLLYPDKQSRIDKETNKTLLPDLGNRSKGVQMVENYLFDR